MENVERNRIRAEFLEEMVDAMTKLHSRDPDFVKKFISMGCDTLESNSTYTEETAHPAKD